MSLVSIMCDFRAISWSSYKIKYHRLLVYHNFLADSNEIWATKYVP